MNPERRVIFFSGRVQGVGFRMTAIHLARDLPLAGTVRNTEDGRVELIVEGSIEHIDSLVARLGEHFGSHIRNVEQVASASAGAQAPGLRVIH